MKINKCPWCGAKPKLDMVGGMAIVHCIKCKMCGAASAVDQGAVLAWNTLSTERQWAAKTVRKIHRKLRKAAGESMGGEE